MECHNSALKTNFDYIELYQKVFKSSFSKDGKVFSLQNNLTLEPTTNLLNNIKTLQGTKLPF